MQISSFYYENLRVSHICPLQAHIAFRSVSYRGAATLKQRIDILTVAMAMAASGALLVLPCSSSSSTTPPLPARISLFTNLTTPPQLRLDKRAGSAIRVWQARKSTSLVLAAAGAGGAAAAAASLAVDSDAPASVLVEKLLSLVEGTDRGTQIGESEKVAIDEIVKKLESQCIPEPLSSPLLFGDWDVAYSSNPTAPGGYYRSMLGRALLKTREMVQNIDAPDRITNRVAFAAFGALDGQVTLQGKLAAVDKKWVEIVFEAPKVCLGSFKMQYGGNSTVKLAILYLDDVVRIGRGSRGSLFIFKRRT